MEVKQVDDVVVTHGDCDEVFVWHFERQAQVNNNKVLCLLLDTHSLCSCPLILSVSSCDLQTLGCSCTLRLFN